MGECAKCLFFFGAIAFFLLHLSPPRQMVSSSRSSDGLAAEVRAPTAGGEGEHWRAMRAQREPAARARFWHLTDAHLNLWHDPHGDVRDMCRSPAPADTPARAPGRFGHFNCDPSPSLLSLALKHMAEVEPNPTFIALGGDDFGHVPASRESAPSVAASQRRVAALVHEAFPHTPVLPAVGNHDTWPYFSLAGAGAARTELAKLYGHHMTPSQREQLAALGYYEVRLRLPMPPVRADAADEAGGQAGLGVGGSAALRVLVLETNALSLREANAEGSGGGGGGAADAQLRWLRARLERAVGANESVVVLGHVAPGASHVDYDSMAAAGWEGGGWTARAQAQLYRQLRREARRARGSPVAAMLFGHLHTGSVRLLPMRGAEGERAGGSTEPPSAQAQIDGGLTPANAATATATAASARASAPDPASAMEGSAASMPVIHLSPSLTPRNPTPHAPAVRLYTLGWGARGGASGRGPDGATARAALEEVGEYALDVDASNAIGEAVWRATPSLRTALGLRRLDRAAEWMQWARDLARNDSAFVAHMSAQRCADEVEADYGRCKAAVLCAMVEPEPAPYARCLRRVSAAAVAPRGWTRATKRTP